MRKPAAIVLLAVIAIAATSWLLWRPADDLPDERASIEQREQIVQSREPSDAPHDHAHADEEVALGRVGANGMPIADDAPVKTEGFPRVEPRRPLDSPGDWVGVRAEAHEKWVKASMDAIEIYGDREQLSEDDYATLQATFGQLHATVEDTRRRIEAGDMLPAEGREVMRVARETVAAEVSELVGEEEMEHLRLEMVKRVPAGGF